jgi:hypothetical protein
MGENKGYPAPAKISPQALDRSVAARLWQISEHMTGVQFVNGALRRASARTSV